MSVKRFCIVLGICVATASVALAQSAIDSVDLRADLRAQSAEVAAPAPPARPTPPGGGDTDSFGRFVQFDGLVQTGTVSFQADCTPDPANPLGPNDRCVTVNPAPATTTFDEADIGQLTIPGRTAHSLLCHWLTPMLDYAFQNSTGGPQEARIYLTPYVIVESPVLADPALIDASTGLPFNGQLKAGFAASYIDQKSLSDGQSEFHYFSESRVCIGGFVNKQNLVGVYGLTEAQASQLFRHEMKLHFGVRGQLRMANGSVTYGLRVVGD